MSLASDDDSLRFSESKSQVHGPWLSVTGTDAPRELCVLTVTVTD
jgi:hypothetical protein